MDKKSRIVFLYTEIAGYVLSCISELMKNYPVEVHLVRWPLNSEAPFDFKFPDQLHVYNRKEYSDVHLMQLISDLNPDMIYTSGWVDKGYKEVCKRFRSKIPIVVGIDNQWDASIRQRIAVLFRGFLIKPFFSHAWVPGESQMKFASKLGFKKENILTGLYSADVSFFNTYYEEFKKVKSQNFPKRFIYVGRYLPFKGIYEMWNAFIELQNENPNDWELWCLGTGDEFDKRIEHDKIKHFGFVQPNEIKGFIEKSGVFILPSQFEPWGVVVHEFSASGFPLICSKKVGSASVFLDENKNGFFIEPGNQNSIKSAMQKIMKLTDQELVNMSEQSNKKANLISPKKWASDFYSLLTK